MRNPTTRGSVRCLGFAQYTNLSSSKKLTDTPASGVALGSSGTISGIAPAYCAIQVDTQSLRYRSDGVAPTATIGILIPTSALFIFDGPLVDFQMIEAAASAVVNIEYYG